MADGVNIDFGGLKTARDPIGGYVNAFKIGQGLGRFGAPANAPAGVYSTMGSPHAGPTPEIGAGRPAMAPPVAADPQTLANQILQARTFNDQLAHVLIGLRQYPPEQRLGIARHLARTTGLMDPASITAVDVTDQGIASHLAEAEKLELFLSQKGIQGPSADVRDQGAVSPEINTPGRGGQDVMNARFAADADRRGMPARPMAPEKAMASTPVSRSKEVATSRVPTSAVQYIGPVV